MEPGDLVDEDVANCKCQRRSLSLIHYASDLMCYAELSTHSHLPLNLFGDVVRIIVACGLKVGTFLHFLEEET